MLEQQDKKIAEFSDENKALMQGNSDLSYKNKALMQKNSDLTNKVEGLKQERSQLGKKVERVVQEKSKILESTTQRILELSDNNQLLKSENNRLMRAQGRNIFKRFFGMFLGQKDLPSVSKPSVQQAVRSDQMVSPNLNDKPAPVKKSALAQSRVTEAKEISESGPKI